MRSSSYLSTSQTAQMLGLSVGTVQRMVESGVLQAYTTQGGHRRILASSIRHYCQAHGVPSLHPMVTSTPVCIIHHSSLDPALRQALQALPQVHLVSHPLELAGLGEDEPAFWVDARVGWLDWPDLERPQGPRPHGRFIVYNSQALSAEQQGRLARHAQLYPEDLSLALVTGFLMGMGGLEARPTPAAEAH